MDAQQSSKSPLAFLTRPLSVSLWGVCIVAFVGGSLAAGLAEAAKFSWFFELFSHFRAQYAILFGLCAMGFALQRRWKWCVPSLLLLGYHLVLVLPLYLGRDPLPKIPKERRFRVLSANVHVGNPSSALFVSLVQKERPEMMLIMECRALWLRGLRALHSMYPYRWEEPREDAFGMAFYSRIRPVFAEIRDLKSAGVPAFTARFVFGQKTLHLLGVHTLPPIREDFARTRDAILREMAKRARVAKGEVLLLGDLNLTSWSPSFGTLLRESRLRDSRQGFGLQNTWSILGLFHIPIDHALVSQGLHIFSRRVGPSIGSDHWPILLEIGL